MKNKICVYTCITGEYDNLKEIENIEKNIDYYCFTNNKNIKSKTWKVIYIEDSSLSNVKLARKTKILGHPLINDNYEILLWMDAAVVFRKKINEFINKYLKDDDVFACFKHGERNNIKDECAACYKYNKESKENINKILDFYTKEEYPDDNGLIESTVFIRRTHNKQVDDTLKMWFEMVNKFSKRDQLSFNYCIYKTGLKVSWINKKVFDNEWFDWINHNIAKESKELKIYFGEYDNNYSMDYDINCSYNEKNNINFNVLVPKTTNKMLIRLEKIPCVIFKSIKINGRELKKNFDLYNCYYFDDKFVFYNTCPVINIEKKVIEGKKINIEIMLEEMNINDVYRFINFLSIKNIKDDNIIRELMNVNEDNIRLNKELNLIVNSKAYKLATNLQNIKKKMHINIKKSSASK